MQTCSTCRGTRWGIFGDGGKAQICPMCDGTGVQFDPGREYAYVMGPLTLNGVGAVSSVLSNGSTLNAVPTQVVNFPFRWMFSMADSTFPFSFQVKEGGSGGQRPFSNAQIVSLNVCGTGQRPLPLPTPFVFAKNLNVVADFTDLGGAAGTLNATNGSAAIAWNAGALFNTAAAPGPPFPGTPLWNGATINIGGVNYVISAVTSQTTLTLATNFIAATAAYAYSVPNNVTFTLKGVELSS
jgi:hypothetical protein